MGCGKQVSRRELELLDKLYSLYIDVLTTMKEYQAIPWTETGAQVDTMKVQVCLHLRQHGCRLWRHC